MAALTNKPMNQTQHTPGPWRLFAHDPEDNTLVITTATAVSPLKEQTIASVAPMPHYDDRQQANARLIAAAPNLLVALQEVLQTYRTFRNVPKTQQEWTTTDDEVYAQAERAIAKAKGETL